jgi:HEAT repeat protein
MSDGEGIDCRLEAETLGSADAAKRVAAAQRLARAGEAAAGAAVALVRACGDSEPEVREWAVAALEDLGPPPGDAVARLVPLVQDREPLAGYWAATLLGRLEGKLGQDAAGAVTALASCIDSAADLSVRQRAAWALGQTGPAAAAAGPALTRAAASGDERLARLAREALESIGGATTG